MDFFTSTQGWRWLQQLESVYSLSSGHIQVLQSQLNEWMGLIPHETGVKWKENGINNFIIGLSKKRLQESKQLRSSNASVEEAMLVLAAAYFQQGLYKEGEELELQVLAGRKKILGDDHLDTLRVMGDLASTYATQGRFKEVEHLGLEVLAGRKKVLGDDHLDTLSAVGNLASTYYNQGRLKEAEDLDLQVVASSKKILGDDHPDTLRARETLASAYRKQGCQEEAEKLYASADE